jgi:hypothetical protein
MFIIVTAKNRYEARRTLRKEYPSAFNIEIWPTIQRTQKGCAGDANR